mgnify:CR=1 FL=1
MKNRLRGWVLSARAARSLGACLLLVALGSLAACDNDRSKQNTPQPTSQLREWLVGSGSKRWYCRQIGSVRLPDSASVNEIDAAEVPKREYEDCEQDDAMIFRYDNKLMYWYGEIPCAEGWPLNEELDSFGFWALVEQDSLLIVPDPFGDHIRFRLKQLTPARLVIRSAEHDSLFFRKHIKVTEVVLESR